MSIASKRILAKLSEIIEASMQSGTMPDPADVQSELAKFVRTSLPNGPISVFRPQQYRGTFNIASYDSMVAEIVEDLQFSFAEQVDQANRLLKALDEVDTRHGAFMHQVDTLSDLLDVLLLSEPRASGYFYAIIDNLRDLAKVDMSQTTAEVDLASGSVFLPMTMGSKKIPFDYLSTKRDIAVVSDEPSKIFTQGTIPGHIFGNAFTDVSNAWQYKLVSSDPNGWTGYITIPVSVVTPRTDVGGTASVSDELQTREIRVSRIDLHGIQTSTLEVRVLYSLDGQNYLKIPGYDWLPLDGRVQSLVFERIKLEFLRLQFRVATPDQIPGTTQYQYIIGLRNISMYDAGFAPEATLISNQLTQDGGNIHRVLLEARETVPEGTEIDYYVAPYSSTPAWLPIKPNSRIKPGESPFIDFSDSIVSKREDNPIPVLATPAINSTRNGITFYEIQTLDGTQIMDTARLYRGVDGWERSISDRTDRIDVFNNYVVFTNSDHFQKLYIEVDSETVTPPNSSANVDTTCFTSRAILDDPALNVVPSSNPSAAIADYSIKEVLLLSSTGVTGSATAAVSWSGTTRTVVISTTAIAQNGLAVGDRIYLVQGGTTEFFRVSSVVNSSGTTMFNVDDQLRKITNGALTFVHNTRNITSLINSVSGASFTVDSSVTLATTDRLLVTYRSPLSDSETPVPASIVVKSDSDASVKYALGKDFTYSRETKGISRSPEGSIAISQEGRVAVRVDFVFERKVANYEIYTTYLKYDGDGSPIDLGTAIGISDGESIKLQINDTQLINISKTTLLEGLQPGWRQLIVTSNALLSAAGTVNTSSAIYKVINATDSDGRLLFGPANFTEKVAIRAPMMPVTLFYLQASVGKNDKTAFAINSNKVIVNYNPAAKNDILYLAPGSSTVQNIERFQIQYSKAASGGTPVTSLLFKAVLRRLSGHSNYCTPMLKGYTLRLSY